MGAGGEYVRFVEATLDLIDASTRLPRRVRFGLGLALVGMCDAERAARIALRGREPRRLEQAAAALGTARSALADAALDVRRGRTITLVP